MLACLSSRSTALLARPPARSTAQARCASGSTTIVTSGTVCTRDALLPDGAVALRDGTIVAVGPAAVVQTQFPRAERTISAEGGLIMPGFINAHAHFYGCFARGMALGAGSNILEQLWWRLDRALDSERSLVSSAELGLLDAVDAGVTTLIDHHSSPHLIDGSLDIIARSTIAAGVRACLAFEVSDRNGDEISRASLRENERFIRRCRRDDAGGLLAGSVGLHALFTLSHPTLERTAALLAELNNDSTPPAVGVHIHVGEFPTDQAEAQRRYDGKRVLQVLSDAALLNSQSLLAHSIDVSDVELEAVRTSRASIVHNVQSNMNNGAGLPNVSRLDAAGINQYGIGTDGMGWSMLREFRVRCLAALANHDVGASVSALWHALTQHNAEIASRLFGRPIGRLEVGNAADVICVDYQPPTPLTVDNLPYHLLYGNVGGSRVRTVICNGRLLKERGVLLDLDERAIASRARAQAPGIWKTALSF